MTTKTKTQPGKALVPAKSESHSNLPAALQGIFKQIKAKLEKLAKVENDSVLTIVRDWFAIGGLVRQVQAAPNKYGGEAVEVLAEELQTTLDRRITAQHLYESGKVATVYTLPHLEAWMAKAAKARVSVSWAHVRKLATLQNKDADALRKRLETEIITQALSSNALMKEIQAKTKKTSQGGRKPMVPKNAPQALKEIAKYNAEIDRRLPGWDDVLFNYLEEIPAEKCDNDLLEELQSTREAVTAQEGTMRLLRSKLDDGIKRVSKLLERKEELEEAKASGKKGKKAPKPAEVEEEDVDEEIDEEVEDEEVEEEEAEEEAAVDEEEETEEEVEEVEEEAEEPEEEDNSVAARIARAKAKAKRG